MEYKYGITAVYKLQRSVRMASPNSGILLVTEIRYILLQTGCIEIPSYHPSILHSIVSVNNNPHISSGLT